MIFVYIRDQLFKNWKKVLLSVLFICWVIVRFLLRLFFDRDLSVCCQISPCILKGSSKLLDRYQICPSEHLYASFIRKQLEDLFQYPIYIAVIVFLSHSQQSLELMVILGYVKGEGLFPFSVNDCLPWRCFLC